MDTKALLQKADIALANIINDGGYMQPEMSNRFVRIMMEEAPLLSQVRMVTMGRPQMIINKLNLAERALRVANQGLISSPNNADFRERALARNDRTRITTSQIDLNTFEAIAEVNIPFEVLEDNIEGGTIDNTQFEETVLSRLAERIRIDIEDLIINGDTTSADPYLSIRDGVLRKAVSNILNNSAGPFDAVMVKSAIDLLPVQFKRLLPRMRMYTSYSRAYDYMLQVALRQTMLGDTVITSGNGHMTPFGVQMIGVPNMPNDRALMLDPQNVIMGVQRQMRIEYDKDVRERVLIIVVTMRFDLEVEQEDQIVRIDNLGPFVPSV